MNVSVIMPLYHPDENILKEIEISLKKQKFDGKFEVIKVDKNLGLAESLNYGIKKAKYDIIVSLHQDCIPFKENWLKTLVSPLKDEGIVASVSDVELPKELWNKFDIFTRALTLKERDILTPLLDEKGCAYKKKVLIDVGLFNEVNFRTAGEDFDVYLRLKDKGKIEYPHSKVIHMHKTNLSKRLKKEYQNSNGYGALVRIYGTKMPSWYRGVLKSIPVLGIVFFIASYPFKKGPSLLPFYMLLTPIINFIYAFGFWKGFFIGRQTV